MEEETTETILLVPRPTLMGRGREGGEEPREREREREGGRKRYRVLRRRIVSRDPTTLGVRRSLRDVEPRNERELGESEHPVNAVTLNLPDELAVTLGPAGIA